MRIIQTLGQSQFIDALKGNGFSYDASAALFDYYTDMGGDDETMEFDAVAIRCDWSEYKTLTEAYEDYEEVEQSEDTKREYFNERTTLIELDDGGVLVGAF